MKAFPILKKYSSLFIKTEPQAITEELLNKLKKDFGLYYFQNTLTKKIDYVGTSTGKSGIKGRVKNQHLSAGYKKSVFRIKLMTEKKILSEKDSVYFIKENYAIGIIYMPEHKSIIKALEQVLIFEYLPKFNSESA
ncbi:MAG: hypothetical protein ABIJ59_17800 [Pseudomonadota bacterium]